jgi:diguanylate cyclase (GGDEF)-like protein
MLARISDPALKERLFSAVYLDRLTGLRNRRWLFDHLPELFKPGATKSYLSLDIDKFGVLNAKVGEERADVVLGRLGAVLSDAVRGTDATVLHLSGEEFVVLAGPGVADASALGESVRRTVEAELGRRAADRGVVDPETGDPLKVTVSVGVADVRPAEGGPEPILTLATAMSESMLQRAKERGRNQVVVDGAPVTASELMARLSRLIRIDDRIRAVVASVIAPSKPELSPTSFDNSYKTRAQALKILGFDPRWRAARAAAADRLTNGLGRGVARARGEDGRAFVVKVAAEADAQNELVLRGFLDAFEVFNGALAAPRAIAYRDVFGPPAVVMPDVPNRHPFMDGAHLPLAHKAALAAFALTFGVTTDPGSFLDVDWSRATMADFARARQETSVTGPDRRRREAPWVSPFYLNDAADYRAALARWREAYARPSARAELAAILRRAGAPEKRIDEDLARFDRNLARLDEVLAGDITRANMDFNRSAAWAALDERETRALSDVNHAAHVSALGGAMRDVLRWLDGGAARPDAPFHVEAEELKAFARRPDAFSRAARLRLAEEADAGRVHRRDGERLSERQALEAFDSLALRLTGSVPR